MVSGGGVPEDVRNFFSDIGRKGGQSRSEAKREACRRNARRPRRGRGGMRGVSADALVVGEVTQSVTHREASNGDSGREVEAAADDAGGVQAQSGEGESGNGEGGA